MGDCTLALDIEVPPEKKVKPWGRLVALSSAVESQDLTTNEFQIGRGPKNDLIINVNVISHVHCRFIREPGETCKDDIVFLEDLSTNGTFVNNDKLGKGNRCLVSNGMEVMICPKKAGVQDKIAFIYQHLYEEEVEIEEGGPQKKYELRDTLGSGAFATVRLAIHKSTGEKFAIKIIDKKKFQMSGSQRKDALMDEVNILMKVSHPNIIGIKEMFDTDKTLYLILELVTGGELFDQILEVGRYTEEQARKLFVQMIDAVEYLHEQGIAHRDLKPENILLKSKTDHTIKLSDFGLSRIIGEGSFMKTLCGTPQYLAPEILKNSEQQGYGVLVDMWSLGVILYILLCGYPPFEESPSCSIFDQVKAGRFEFPDDPWATVSESAKHLIKGLMTLDPQKRVTAKQAKQHPWMKGETTVPKDLKLSGSSTNTSSSAKFSPPVAPASAKNVKNDKEKEKEEKEKEKAKDDKKDNTSSKNSSPANDDSEDDDLPPPSRRKASEAPAKKTVDRGGSSSSSISKKHSSTRQDDDEDVLSSGGESSRPRVKRQRTDPEEDNRPMCKYGQKCYRKNPAHFREFRHPHLDD